MSPIHPDPKGIAARLGKEGISKLYHFTSVKNLSGIAKHQAILSRKTLEDKGEWPPPEPGGNALSHYLDEQKGNLNYVPLNLTPWTPMAYRVKSRYHLCFFEILPDVAAQDGVIFTDSNATRSGQERGVGLDGLEVIKFDMVRSNPLPWSLDWFDYCQAEVLVPKSVSIDNISRVVFVSEASLNEGIRVWGEHQRPAFEIDRTVFADYPNHSESIDFSHVANISLTSSPITGESAWGNYPSSARFDRKSCKTVTALVEAWANAGAEGKVTWYPNNQVDSTTFTQTNKYRWFPQTSLAKVPDGKCSVEVRLNDVIWAVCEFEVF